MRLRFAAHASDARMIAEAFRNIYSEAMVIHAVLTRNHALNNSVPESWPLKLSADAFAAECLAMAEHYDKIAREQNNGGDNESVPKSTA